MLGIILDPRYQIRTTKPSIDIVEGRNLPSEVCDPAATHSGVVDMTEDHEYIKLGTENFLEVLSKIKVPAHQKIRQQPEARNTKLDSVKNAVI